MYAFIHYNPTLILNDVNVHSSDNAVLSMTHGNVQFIWLMFESHHSRRRFSCSTLKMSRCVLEGVSPEIVHTASFGEDVKPSVPGDLGP